MFKETIKLSPNVSAGTIKPTGILLHHTAGAYSGSVAWCLNKKSEVSYHCIVDLNGDRTVLARSNKKAWHAGDSTYKGQKWCNNYMLGIAVSGDTNKRELTDAEVKSVAEWCVREMKAHKIALDDVTTHRAVSNTGKTDVDERAFKLILKEIEMLLK